MPTVVGLLTVTLRIPEARSLKDKRQVVKSLLDRTANRFNVSVAELGRNDSRNGAQLGFACVANDAAHVQRVLDAVAQSIRSEPRVVIEDHQTEML